ncbi:hypothetical protein [Nonomuraea sp. NPDC003201]
MNAHDVARLLPEIPVLRDFCRSMAVLEAILSPDWESRRHSFDAGWAPGEEMASMRNGSGDEYSIVFVAGGAYVRGFDHEAAMSPYGNDGPWPGVLDSVPDVFRHCVEEPAFRDENGLPVDLDAIRHVHALRPLTQAVVTTLNADLTLDDLTEDLAEARYPSRA